MPASPTTVTSSGPPGRPRHQHGPGRGQLLEPGGGPQRLAGDPPAALVAAGPDQHLPGGHGRQHPHRRRPGRGARRGLPVPRARGQGVADGQGGSHGPLGVVVAGAGDAEQGHGAPANRLGDDPAVGLDLGPDAGQLAREQPPGVLRVQVGEALAGFVDIDQQDGDQLAFGAAWRVRWGGARQSPILTRASYGSCGRSQPSPSRDPGLTPTDAQPGCPLQDPLGHERGHQPHNQPFGLMKPHNMA